MARSTLITLASVVWVSVAAATLTGQGALGLRFAVTLDPSLPPQPGGRLIVVMSPGDASRSVDPRRLIGQTGRLAAPSIGIDVARFAPGDQFILDGGAETFPLERLADLPAGEYRVQAVLRTNRDLRLIDAPGNLYSEPLRVSLRHDQESPVALRLRHIVPAEALPPDDGQLRFVKIRSTLLSEFHGRPIFLRGGVVLPRGHGDEPSRRYPLRVHTGGYGARYTRVRAMMRPGSAFRTAWFAPDSPRMILLHLDGAGPLGDPYQINSANNGPYGHAITRELIPHVERLFGAVGQPHARVLDGSSTGGWVSLALQMFYPDVFNGVWASCPDSVDFRGLQLVDIYGDRNVYVDAEGRERPSARNRDGSVRFTMRHELAMENVLGAGDSWTTSGFQWGAWNAVYGPRGEDGRPIPLWDPETGLIATEVARHWEQYDLRLRLERHWDQLAPLLAGKLNIWVGEMDDYYLNDAVRLLDRFLQTRPSLGARFEYGPGQGHCWTGLSDLEMMREMGRQTTP